MAKLNINMDVEILDDDICRNCEHISIQRVKKKNAYEQEINVVQCKNKDLCKYLLEHIATNAF